MLLFIFFSFTSDGAVNVKGGQSAEKREAHQALEKLKNEPLKRQKTLEIEDPALEVERLKSSRQVNFCLPVRNGKGTTPGSKMASLGVSCVSPTVWTLKGRFRLVRKAKL